MGSVENRLALQDQYDCYFIIANKHAFSTRAEQPGDIRQSVIDIATDYLAAGIDPNKSTMFIQSEVPAIDELTFFFSMLLPFNVVMKNPTIKDEIRDKGLGRQLPLRVPALCGRADGGYPRISSADRAGRRRSASAPGTHAAGRPAVRPALLWRGSADAGQGLCQSRRPVPRDRAEAGPGATPGRNRRPRAQRRTAEDEQVAEQRHLPVR